MIRIYSTHLFPLYSFEKSNSPKLTFFLVLLNKHSKLNHLNCPSPNEIHNDNLDERLKWMNFKELEQAQQSYRLLGLEPVLFFKKFIIESSELNLMVDNIFYEPKMTYFQCENQLVGTQSPSLIDLMVSSAKFHKNGNYSNVYYKLIKFRALKKKFISLTYLIMALLVHFYFSSEK